MFNICKTKKNDSFGKAADDTKANGAKENNG